MSEEYQVTEELEKDPDAGNRSFRRGMQVGALLMLVGIVLLAGSLVMISVVTGIWRPVGAGEVSPEAVRRAIDDNIDEINAYIDESYILDVDYSKMKTESLKGYVAGLGDVYSSYFTAEEYQKKLESSNGSFVGIGVAVQETAGEGHVTVWNVYPGSPAEKAGMLEGDVIIGVNGTDVRDTEMSGIVTLIRGEEGSPVTVRVLRGARELDLEMTREKVDKHTVSAEMLGEEVGYISLVEFDSVSVEQMKEAILDLRSRGMKKLVLDLRGNPGGVLDSVLGIADIFLPEVNIFYAMNKAGTRTDYDSTAEQLCTEPMAVLVNGDSASASEVLAGSLQDHGRAVIVGEQTYGKGIIQSYYTLRDGSAVKLTIAHYFTPKGADIHGVGITPDVVLADDENTAFQDEQLQAALASLK